ncbi:MAG: AmmeMemoRadiSam system protein B [Pseudomonadota bacterium]
MQSTRPAAVAGLFYPQNPRVLTGDVGRYLEAARQFSYQPKALVVPHAGYVYSAPIAASAYRLLAPMSKRIRRVVLLGPAHRVWVRSLALPEEQYFATPLGKLDLDSDAIATISHLPQVDIVPDAHAREHALEVQLPFLQLVLGYFRLVPLLVGGATPDEVAEVLDYLWGGKETVIVVSSDLSHYFPYTTGNKVDKATAQAILDLRTDLVGEQACGAHALNGLCLAARNHCLHPHLLDLRNSGDTAGDRERVVGYGAFAFTEAP